MIDSVYSVEICIFCEGFRFTAKEWDEETGLYYYGARYMDPKTSRWMSVDPAGYQLMNPMGQDGKPRQGYSIVEATNWYSYVSNNPVKYKDPTGYSGEDTIIENERGKRDAAYKTTIIQQEKLIKLYTEQANLGTKLQEDLKKLKKEYKQYAENATKDIFNQTKRTVEDGILTLGDATPEWSGFDFIKSFFDQVKGFFSRRKRESEFLARREDLFNEYHERMDDLQLQINIEKDILNDAKNTLIETDRTIGEL